ncbi:hypothetical protein CBR_g28618 [Chara braunii]|uniref:DUF659 domain-containing protein n=1 Tax=Chara braunii TaxID=69332 RepID=A0A388L9E4_CHABU|nr:hypothetical protein CBR_g28618 [Chara braunii]|eukprot:GBG78904.1 hypothetical protein CBR_g28618 [Chara braunii]
MSRGVGRAGPAPRASQHELKRARREKRAVGEADVEVRDTGREKRARQTTIEEMYDKEKLAEFTDAWLQWIYEKGLPFNVVRGPEFQRVRQAAERVPRTIQFRFPSYKVTAGAGIPSQRAKVTTMVSEVRAAFRHTCATILSDGRKSRSGKPLVNFLAGGANGAMLYATVARDGSVRDTADIVYRRWRAIILSFPAKDVIGFCTNSASRRDSLESMLHEDAWARIPWERRLVSQAQWVQQQIQDGEFWRCVQYAILVMAPVHQLLRRMDRGGMMMSVVYEWSQHVLRLMRRVDMSADMIEPCGDRETERCAAWWFDHGRAHPELRTIAICVMHLWTSASPAERNWAQHERINTARCVKLGFAKLAQLVEIATNLKLASCARQGGGYVLPWVIGTGQEGTAAEDEDEEGDVEPEVWGARPAGSVLEQDIQRQIVTFHDSRPSRAHSVQDVFGKRSTELRPWPKGGDDAETDAGDDDIDDQWTDDDDAPLSGDATAERVYFTYGGGRDGMASFTSVITGDVPSTEQASGSSRADGRRGGRSHAEVGVDGSGEKEPRGGLRQTGRRWEVRSDSEAEGEAEDEEVPLRDRRFSPSHHPISAQPEALRRLERLASTVGTDWTHDGEDRGGERTPSDARMRPRSPSELRTHDFDVGGLGGGLGDFSVDGRRRTSPSTVRIDEDVVRGRVETEEERHAHLDREEEERLRTLPQWEGRSPYLEEQRRQRELETGGGGGRDADDSGVPEEAVQGEFVDEGQDAAAGGGSGGGRRDDGETAVDEGQDVAVGGGSW